MQETEQTHH